MEDYKEKYEMAPERAKKFIEENPLVQNLNTWIKETFPELAGDEDERTRKEIIEYIKTGTYHKSWIAWLEKQGEQKPVQEIEPFEAEHGKYYYCIKDYFCGGRKQASKGDVVQALRGMAMMALGDKASEYFLPVNHIEQNHAWSKEDEEMKINSIEVNIKIKYETTYIHGVQHYTSSNRNFFVNEEKYEQILKILEE